MTEYEVIVQKIQKLSSPERAIASARYFKTGPGQYGEGDIFFGLRVPECRSIAKKHRGVSLHACERLLQNPIHEYRLIALLILVSQFQHGDDTQRKKIFDFYLAHTDRINNWDLVDTSADKIVGEWVADHDQATLLERLARSGNIWEKRIAILSTFAYIRRGRSDVTYIIADMLGEESEDLIHKAVGWLLREVGKRIDQGTLKKYLYSRYKKMPRTMLRYAIEHFDETDRQAYLRGQVE